MSQMILILLKFLCFQVVARPIADCGYTKLTNPNTFWISF